MINSMLPKLNLLVGITGLYFQINILNPKIKELDIKLDNIEKNNNSNKFNKN